MKFTQIPSLRSMEAQRPLSDFRAFPDLSVMGLSSQYLHLLSLY